MNHTEIVYKEILKVIKETNQQVDINTLIARLTMLTRKEILSATDNLCVQRVIRRNVRGGKGKFSLIGVYKRPYTSGDSLHIPKNKYTEFEPFVFKKNK